MWCVLQVEASDNGGFITQSNITFIANRSDHAAEYMCQASNHQLHGVVYKSINLDVACKNLTLVFIWQSRTAIFWWILQLLGSENAMHWQTSAGYFQKNDMLFFERVFYYFIKRIEFDEHQWWLHLAKVWSSLCAVMVRSLEVFCEITYEYPKLDAVGVFNYSKHC